MTKTFITAKSHPFANPDRPVKMPFGAIVDGFIRPATSSVKSNFEIFEA